MDVPHSCSHWEEMMRSDEDAANILENIQAEVCLPDPVVDDFFSEIAAETPPQNAQEARNIAESIVKNGKETFLFQRREVPNNRFSELCRLEQPSALRYRIPDEELDKRGLRDLDLSADINEEDLRAVTDEYDGHVTLGDQLEVVWSSDFVETEPYLDDLHRLADLLGLNWNERYAILCRYRRIDTGRTLHVPSALDGVKHPRFKVVVDCEAECGKTRRASGNPDDGLSEVVHEKCTVRPLMWQLG